MQREEGFMAVLQLPDDVGAHSQGKVTAKADIPT